ncbi:hypothetical protein LSAT2_030893 [Lamellibrachia satsuma]|nr:hypothetical protein LSAT2_030893 [Lamellibrachia satsuma]
MDTEMNNQQKHVIGMFGGLSVDVNKLVEKIPENTSLDITETNHVIRTLRQLAIRAMKILQSSREGKLGILRADMPDHYLSTTEVLNSPLKKLSTAYGGRSNSPRKDNTDAQPENGSGATKSEFSGKMGDRLSTLRESDNFLREAGITVKVEHLGLVFRKMHSQSYDGAFNIAGMTTGMVALMLTNNQKSNANSPVQESAGHPELVNPITGFVNMIRVMKHFPHMTQSYVKEQWDMFHQYDTNKDGTLDLPEMMLAMTSTLGQQFTATQVKEALTEVDADGSSTIDFFEYLSVADMLQNKKGRSEVFRSSLVQQQGRHVSKTCAVM